MVVFKAHKFIVTGVLLGLLSISSVNAANTLKLSVDKADDTIHREVYGALLEDWGRDIYGGLYVGDTSSIPNTNGMRNDVIAGLQECKIGQLQWPGGCAAEQYIWTNGIGDKATRQSKGYGMGTDEYFQLCSLTNSIPFLQCNTWYDADYNENNKAIAHSLADWLRYIHTKYSHYDLKWLGIGNEPWGGCGTHIDSLTYCNGYDTLVDSIPSYYSGNLGRISSAGVYGSPAYSYYVIHRTLGKAEGLAWHAYTTYDWGGLGNVYPSVDYPDSQYYMFLSKAYDMKEWISWVEDTLDKYDPNYTMGLMVTEWGTWYDSIPGTSKTYQQSTVRDAQVAAYNLNLFNNKCKRITMAGIGQPVNVLQSLFLTKVPATASLIKTPTFYVFKLFAPHQNARMIPSELSCDKVNSMEVINASASIDSNEVMHISLANIHKDSSKTVTIDISGASSKFQYTRGQIINGPTIQSHNGFDSAETVNIQDFDSTNYSLNDTTLTVTLPAHSVVMMTMSATPIGIISRSVSSVKAGHFSIATVKGNKIVLTYNTDKVMPVKLSLFSVDGKRLVGTYNGTLESGHNSVVWQPKNMTLGNNVFVVKMDAGTNSMSQRIFFTK
jgi:alpha-L-arabinofuranosidase